MPKLHLQSDKLLLAKLLNQRVERKERLLKMVKPVITRIASGIQPHLTNEEINACLEGKSQIEWVMGSVSNKSELWTCPLERINVLAGPLSQKGMELYLRIKERHYIIEKENKQINRNKHASPAGIYFFWCCANCEPYISIRYARKYCTVSIDLITLEDLRQTTLNAEGRRKVGELFDKYSIRRVGANWCPSPLGTFSYSNSIRKEKGTEVASELYRIWQKNKEVSVNNGGLSK